MTTPCVLGASAVVRLFRHDPHASDWVMQLRQSPLVFSPELMLTEVANALWRPERAGDLSSMDPRILLSDARDLVDPIEPDRHLLVEALAHHLAHPVCDRRLHELAQRVLP